MDFDATSLHPSGRWDENSFYPSIEIGYAYSTVMSDELVEKFKGCNFIQRSAILKKMNCS